MTKCHQFFFDPVNGTPDTLTWTVHLIFILTHERTRQLKNKVENKTDTHIRWRQNSRKHGPFTDHALDCAVNHPTHESTIG